MADPDPGDLGGHLVAQAEACEELGSPLYGRLLRACVDDLAAGGPVVRVLAGQVDARRSDLVGLRLLGCVHHRVLTGRAPRLARHYPSVGGTPAPDLVPAFLAAVADGEDDMAGWLSQPPQTNEVGRSAALVGGLLRVLDGRDLPVRLHEIGASAGLNLHADRYRFRAGTDGPWWGTESSPVALEDAWRGAVPPPSAPLRVVERAGSDIAPLDLAGHCAAERLLAYVWADQLPRLHRTRAALEVAAAHPVAVARLGAGDAVRGLRLRSGHLTVLWHSVMWQYLPEQEQRSVEETLAGLGATATTAAPLVRLSLEPEQPPDGGPEAWLVTATTWPGGARTVLGRSAPHGVPTTWSP